MMTEQEYKEHTDVPEDAARPGAAADSQTELLQRVLAAKTDEAAFETLVGQNRRWILRCASESARRFVTESDDEWSVALIAFHEAVQSYEEGKGSFRALASVVIRRRVLDYLRSEGRHGAELTVLPGAFDGELEEEEATALSLAVQRAVAAQSLDDDTASRAERAREEIGEMQAILKLYGFSFYDLTECSPKAEKTKRSCAQAVRTLIASAVMLALMRLKRLLPIKELSAESGVVRKILERHRKYIIASAEILDGDFPILASYLAYIRKGQKL